MRNTIQTFFFIQHQLTATVKLLCIVKGDPYDRGKNDPRWMKVNFQESRICILRSTL